MKNENTPKMPEAYVGKPSAERAFLARQAQPTKYSCELCGYKSDYKNAIGKHKNLAHGIKGESYKRYLKYKAKQAAQGEESDYKRLLRLEKMRENSRKWRKRKALAQGEGRIVRAYDFTKASEPTPAADLAIKFCPHCGFKLGRITIE